MTVKEQKHLSILERFGYQPKHKQDLYVEHSAETQTKTEWLPFPTVVDRGAIPASWLPKRNAEGSSAPVFTRNVPKGEIK
jgi:hypothetical protein